MHLTSKLPNVGTTIFTEMTALANQHGATNLAQGFPDIILDPSLAAHLHEAANTHYNQYAPMTGLPLLLEAIQEKIKKRNKVDLDAFNEVTITPGATYGIYTSLASIIHPGDEVIILEPAYDSYSPNVSLLGGVVIPIALQTNNFSVDWNLVKSRITHKTKAIIINTPHNPTGTVWQNSDYEALRDCVRGTNIFIVSDEVYEYLNFSNEGHYSLLEDEELYQRSFVVCSFGKVMQNTGWKIGYVVAPKLLSAEFRKIHQYLAFSVNAPAQYATAQYLKDPHELDLLSKSFAQKRDFFLAQFKDLPFQVPFISQGSYFQLMSYEGLSDLDDKAYAVELTKQAGVASIPVSSFYTAPKQDKLLRFCFAKNATTVETAAQKLKQYFNL